MRGNQALAECVQDANGVATGLVSMGVPMEQAQETAFQGRESLERGLLPQK